MGSVIKTRIMKIGNEQCVLIPKRLLDQINLGDHVELALENNQIVIRPALPARHGWDEAFQAMSAAGDDALLDGESLIDTAESAEDTDKYLSKTEG